MIIKLTIELKLKHDRNFRSIPDKHILEEGEGRQLSLLGLEGYVRRLVKFYQDGRGRLDFKVSASELYEKE